MTGRDTVSRYLYRAFAVMVGLILVTGVVATTAAVEQFRVVAALTAQVMPERLANAEVRAALNEAQRGIRGYLLTGDPTLDTVYADARHDFTIAAADLRRLAPPADRAAVALQVDQAGAWLRVADEHRRRPLDGDRGLAFARQARPLFDQFLASNAGLERDLADRSDDLRERTRRAEVLAIWILGAATALGVLVSVVIAVLVGRRITRPLAALVATLSQLRGGDLSARAPVAGPADVRAVASTLNTLSEENEQARAAARSRTRLRDAAREAGLRVREHLSVASALDAAAEVLGREFGADLVMVRLAAADGQEQRSICWPADDSVTGCALSGLPVSWLADRFVRGEAWRAGDLRAETNGVPAEERAALLAAGAVSALTVPFGSGPAPDGAITMVRTRPGEPWQPGEVEAAEWVAADVGRGVQQGRLYEQEQRLVGELRELDRSKSAFLSTVSHELRTPLTSISGFAELLHDTTAGPLTDEQLRMVDAIERNTNRLRVLIEDLLTLSRVEAGTFRTVRQPVDVAELVAQAVRTVSPAGLTVRLEGPAGPLMAMVDPYQIDRVTVNLLSNAVKFTPAGGHVTVRVRDIDDDVVLSVSDDGIGIPTGEQPELFNRFFRASNAVVRSIPGTGLGLTIVRTIVSNHGGDVTVHSRPGEGTTVTVRLPRTPVLVP